MTEVLIITDLKQGDALASAKRLGIACQIVRTAGPETRRTTILKANMSQYPQILSWWISGEIRRTVKP